MWLRLHSFGIRFFFSLNLTWLTLRYLWSVGSSLSTPLMICVWQAKFIQHFWMLLNSKKSLKCKMLTLKCFLKKRDLGVASTRHHLVRLPKYYPRRPCAPSFVKSRIRRPLERHFLLFQQIFFILAYIHARNPRVPPMRGQSSCSLSH